MNILRSCAISAAVVAGATGFACADFLVGVPILITGTAGPEFGGTTWGSGANPSQGPHLMGGQSIFFDQAAPGLEVVVNSTVNNLNSLTLTVDFSGFFPGDFTNLTMEVLRLKADGSILSVIASQGVATVNLDGNGFTWAGSGDIDPQIVTFEITQVPTPGAAILLGLGGLVASRRRRG